MLPKREAWESHGKPLLGVLSLEIMVRVTELRDSLLPSNLLADEE